MACVLPSGSPHTYCSLETVVKWLLYKQSNTHSSRLQVQQVYLSIRFLWWFNEMEAVRTIKYALVILAGYALLMTLTITALAFFITLAWSLHNLCNIHSITKINHHFNPATTATIRAAWIVLNLRNRLQTFRDKCSHWHVSLVPTTFALKV
jgi:hypothetical protein